MLWRGRLQEAQSWLERAENAGQPDTEPAAALMLHANRALLDLADARYEDALREVRAAQRLEGLSVTPHTVARGTQAYLLDTLIRMGESDRVERSLAETDPQALQSTPMRIVLAHLRLAQGDADAAAAHPHPPLRQVIDAASRRGRAARGAAERQRAAGAAVPPDQSARR
jgi:LuxR family maltose regulon positive regulatory protein